jgi:hypothetical protein
VFTIWQKFSKIAKLFAIWTWYCSLTTSSFIFLKLLLCPFTYRMSLPNFCHEQRVVSTTHTLYRTDNYCLFTYFTLHNIIYCFIYLPATLQLILFISTFIYLFIYSFIHSFIHPFIRWTTAVRLPVGAGIFFSSPPPPDQLWGKPNLLSKGYRGISRIKCLGRESDHSLPSSPEVTNAYCCTSTPPIRLHSMVLK